MTPPGILYPSYIGRREGSTTLFLLAQTIDGYLFQHVQLPKQETIP